MSGIRRTLVFGAVALLAAGCDTAGGRLDSRDLRGVVLPQAMAKADFTLTDTSGRPYHFRRETDGYLTLLFFGYTHCPDVCPVHMANIASVLGRLPVQVSGRVKVVFVSTDPERDSRERIREWLDNFSTKFVGLRGDIDSVNAIQRRFNLAASVRQEADSSGDYLVGHAAQVIAFTADDSARVLYPFGTRQTDWAHDLPLLARVGSSAD